MHKIEKLFVSPETSIKETMRVIDYGAVRTALIVDASQKLIGIVTDGDIRRGILAGIDIEESISKVMNPNPASAPVGTPSKELYDMMKNEQIGIPLLDSEGRVKEFSLLSDDVRIIPNRAKNVTNHLDRILVIGGAGYIGSVLTQKLLKKGYKVTVLDTFLYGDSSLEDSKTNENLTILKGDTRHVEDITRATRDVDAVVYLAELVGDPACALDPSLTQEFNYLATKLIADVCKHYQINRLVYMSSCSVYGASTGKELLTEESSLNPVSLYAKMKIASERSLNDLQDENFMPTILRLGTVFGFSPRPRFDLVVNILTAKALREGKITIFGGDQWRPNVHVADVADTIIAVLEAPIEKIGGQVFNVGTEKNNHTIDEIGMIVKEVIPGAEIVRTSSEADKRDYKVDFTKLRETLGVSMRFGVKEGIQEIKNALEKDLSIKYTDKTYSNIAFLKDTMGKNT